MIGGRRWLIALAAVVGVSGCATTTKLDHVVVDYDTTTALSISKLLLLNIARARNNQPMHFTGISNIVATYRFSVGGGIGPAATGDRGYLPVPFLSGSVEENPTVSIEPMSGEEFTQRLLTPFPEQKLTLLLRQGYDVDALFRAANGVGVRQIAGGWWSRARTHKRLGMERVASAQSLLYEDKRIRE